MHKTEHGSWDTCMLERQSITTCSMRRRGTTRHGSGRGYQRACIWSSLGEAARMRSMGKFVRMRLCALPSVRHFVIAKKNVAYTGRPCEESSATIGCRPMPRADVFRALGYGGTGLSSSLSALTGGDLSQEPLPLRGWQPALAGTPILGIF